MADLEKSDTMADLEKSDTMADLEKSDTMTDLECGGPAKIKPPRGLRPKADADRDRQREIVEAMARFHNAHKDIPFEWVEELLEIVKRLARE